MIEYESPADMAEISTKLLTKPFKMSGLMALKLTARRFVNTLYLNILYRVVRGKMGLWENGSLWCAF